MAKRKTGGLKLLVAVVALVVGILILRYEYKNYITAKGDVKEQESVLSQKQERLRKLQGFAEQYDALPDRINRLKHVIPTTKDVPEILTQLEVIATRNEMVFEAVYFEDVGTVSGVSRGISNKVSSSGNLPKDVVAMPIKLVASGSYVHFREYVKDLERNIRLLDVGDVSMQNGSYSISATVYYLEGGES